MCLYRDIYTSAEARAVNVPFGTGCMADAFLVSAVQKVFMWQKKKGSHYNFVLVYVYVVLIT